MSEASTRLLDIVGAVALGFLLLLLVAAFDTVCKQLPNAWSALGASALPVLPSARRGVFILVVLGLEH